MQQLELKLPRVFSADNLAWIVACELSKSEDPNASQLMAGYRLLIRSTIQRGKLKLNVTKHLAEYREAKSILIGAKS